MLSALHTHQGIGNRLYRALEVTFRNDGSRVQRDQTRRNPTVGGRIVMDQPTLVKECGSIRLIGRKVGWSDGRSPHIFRASHSCNAHIHHFCSIDVPLHQCQNDSLKGKPSEEVGSDGVDHGRPSGYRFRL